MNVGDPSVASGNWRVVVGVREHMVDREVYYGETRWDPREGDDHVGGQVADEVIWPTWPATLQEEMDAATTPLADLQARWDETTGRLRDSAKWMATVIGAALASLIPTAPLTGLSRHITVVPAVLGVAGLLFVSITMVLVLRVMQPQSVSYNDIQNAKERVGLRGVFRMVTSKRSGSNRIFDNSLFNWKRNIEDHPDLYLPCGVKSLVALRKLMVVEEVTLMALACAEEYSQNDVASEKLRKARAARAARLHELRAAAASVVALGVYYQVQTRSNWATYVGAAFALLGIIAIVSAVAWR